MAGRGPAEILQSILSQLDDDDIAASSGVNLWWYLNAKKCLFTRSRSHLCRNADAPSADAETVILAGNITLEKITELELPRLKCLKLWYDEPSSIDAQILKQLLENSCDLSALELLNIYEIPQDAVETIMTHCEPGLKLKIRFSGKLDVSGIEMLQQHRELFKEILVESTSNQTVIGWFSAACSGESTYRIKPSTTSLTLDCPGLRTMTASNACHIQTMTLHKSCCLTETILLTISQLCLHTFQIDGFEAGEFIWLQSFSEGFVHLESLTITNCVNLTDNVLNSLSNKRLRSLTIDLRHKPAEPEGISHLYKLQHLRKLHLIMTQIQTDTLLNGVLSCWLNLDLLIVEEDLLGYDETVEAMTRLRDSLQLSTTVNLIHKINASRIVESSFPEKFV